MFASYASACEFGSKEAQFLVRCARPILNADELRSLAGDNLNWEKLLEISITHGVMPLLYWRLKEIDGHISSSLEAAFQSNIRQNLEFSGELLKLSALFAREQIPLLPFKGPALALAAYQNLALRQFVDLDLLVPRCAAIRARDLLLSIGYTTDLRLSSAHEKRYLQTYDEFAMLGADGRTIVEIHWSVVPQKFSVNLDTSQFWTKAQILKFGINPIASLCPEDHLLVLCLHGSKHCWSQLGLIADIAWLISTRPEINWREILRQATMIGSYRMVLVGLELSHKIFGTVIPDPISHSISKDPTVCVLTNDVTASLFAPTTSSGRMWRAALFHMRSREHLHDRLLYLYRTIMTPGVEDWQMVDLPKPLSWAYGFLRFPRLLWKYWLRLP